MVIYIILMSIIQELELNSIQPKGRCGQYFNKQNLKSLAVHQRLVEILLYYLCCRQYT